MPRVAIVTHGFNSPAGGARTMTLFLHRMLAESGRYEPHIVSMATWSADRSSVLLTSPASWRHGIRTERGVSSGIPYVHVGAFGAELEFQRYRPRTCLSSLLSEFDLVQFVTGTPSWAAAMPGSLLWTATTIRPDRASRLQAASGLRRLILESMTRTAQYYERQALQNSSHVFALSEYTRRSVAPWTPPERLEVAPCGIDTAFFHPADAPSGNPPYNLSVSRFSDPRKNLRLLLTAYNQFWTPQAPELWLAGQADDEAIAWASRLPSAASIRFLGARNAQELAGLYRNALFFVLSSDEEGLGIVVLEAMASGLPIISTRCGGPESIVDPGETGLLVPLNSPADLAAAMDQLTASSSLRLRMARQARAAALERFSIQAAGAVFLSRYDSLAPKPKPASIQQPISSRA